VGLVVVARGKWEAALLRVVVVVMSAELANVLSRFGPAFAGQ
jgi:hypothetical protein